MDQALESSPKLDYLSELEKDKLLEVLLSDSPEAIVYCTPDLAIRMANRVFSQLVGLTMEKVIGSSVVSLLPDFQQLEGLLQKSRITKKASGSKLKLPLAGTGPWCTHWKVTINPLFNGIDFTGWLLAFKEPAGRALEDLQPASETKETKSTLMSKQFSEKILTALSDVLPFGCWTCSPGGEVVAVSDTFLKTTGLAREECIGSGWSVLLPEIDRESLVSGWKECFRQESGWTYQFWLRCSTGEYRVVTAQGFPVRNSVGAVSSWFVINFDTTTQHLEHEQRTKEAMLWQQLFKAVVNHAPLGIAMYSGADMSLSWANAHFRQFLETSEAARTRAGVVLENHLPYTDNLQFDEVFYRAITNREVSAALEVHFAQTPDSYWNCTVVPLTGLGEPGTDVMVIAVQIPAPITAGPASATEEVLEPVKSETQDQVVKDVALQENQQKRTQQLATMMSELNHATNLADILRTAARLGVQVLQANDGGIYLFATENGNYQGIYELWLDENTNRYVNIKEMPNIQRTIGSLKPHYFTAGEAEEKETDWFRRTGLTGCLVIPLVLQENCIGLLFLFYNSQELNISEEEREFATMMAEKCALVIDRAHTQLEKSRLLISERRARSRAERQAAEMSALLQSLREGVLVLDANGNIVLRNRMERLITRVEDEQALSIVAYGRFRLLTPDGKPVPPQQLPGNRLLRGDTLDDTEYIIEHADGTRLHVISNGSVVRGEDGQVVFGILVTRDVSRVRELETVREDLIRAVSHDLRNPLTVISARSQLLQRRMNKHGLAAEAEEAEVIYISARRMTQMIQEMFDSYRLESNNYQLNREFIDLDVVLRELSTRLGTEEDRKRVRMEIAAGNYRLCGDQERLERAIINLITNALKYSPVDKPVVVSLACQGEQIYLSVTDWGVGIAPEDISKVFQRYYRSSTVKNSAGLGLGLYIVKLIVEAHHGTVDVVSKPGEGSTFRIVLPQLMEESCVEAN